MTDTEIQLLCIGFTLGGYFMVLVQIGFGILDDRRDRKALCAAKAKLKQSEPSPNLGEGSGPALRERAAS